ncbi:hypothetical protein [Arthrospiribacter ruber]|uniref:Uncharacterized protein n=1 Tax=Arthrospiribacter ruber TaxID=2487934 RepID=A0A951IZX2_9BACT|nr:hypothetical protein [Arthrospiribacter ruber]MBW3470210.1 hypothetical protein [Arthrospiribacter ruber]
MIAGIIEFPMPQDLDRSPQNTNQRDFDNEYLRGVFCSGQSLLKLHMNWGWGGLGNGLFSYNNWTVTLPTGQTFNFNNNKTMVFNIIP